MRLECILQAFVIFSLFCGIVSFRFGDEDTMRFAVVDVAVYLLSFQSVLNTLGVEYLELATQVFLEGALNVHPTTIIDLQVAVTSQSLRHGFNSTGNSTFYKLTANMQIMLKYQMAYNEPGLSDMDKKVRKIIEQDSEELLGMLKLLESSYFGSLHTIELKPRTLGFTQSSQNDQGRKKESSAPTGAIIIFALVGIGMFISLFILIPNWKSRNRYVGEDDGVVQKSEGLFANWSFTMERPQPSERKHPYRNRTMSTSGTGIQGACVGATSSLSTNSVYFQSDTKGYIQRIYSDDQVNHPLSGLRVNKVYAADNLKRSLSGFGRTIESSDPYHMGISRVLTPSTENASSTDVESPVAPVRKVREKTKQSRTKHHKLKRSHRQNRQQDENSFKSFWIAPACESQSDLSSVSKLTNGDASTDEEDEALDVLSVDPGSRLHLGRSRLHRACRGNEQQPAKPKPKNRVDPPVSKELHKSKAYRNRGQHDKIKRHSSAASIDDFGSIARSNPGMSCDGRNQSISS